MFLKLRCTIIRLFLYLVLMATNTPIVKTQHSYNLLNKMKIAQNKQDTAERVLTSLLPCINASEVLQVFLRLPSSLEDESFEAAEATVKCFHSWGVPVLQSPDVYVRGGTGALVAEVISGSHLKGVGERLPHDIVRRWALAKSTAGAMGRFLLLLTSPMNNGHRAVLNCFQALLKEMYSPRLAILLLYPEINDYWMKSRNSKRVTIFVLNPKGVPKLLATPIRLEQLCDPQPWNFFAGPTNNNLGPLYVIWFTPISRRHGWQNRKKIWELEGPDLRMMALLKDRRLIPAYFLNTYVTFNHVHVRRELVAWMTASTPSYYSADKVLVSPALFQDDPYMLVRRAPPLPFWRVLLLPLQLKARLATAVTVLALAATWRAAQGFLDGGRTHHEWWRWVTDILQLSLTGSVSACRMQMTSQKGIALLGMWLFIIVGSAYQGLLLGFLTVPKHMEVLNKISDVAKSVDIIYGPPFTGDFIVETRSSDLEFSEVDVKIKTIFSFEQEQEAFKKLLEGENAAMLLSKDMIRYFLKQPLSSSTPQLHMAMEPLISPVLHCYILQRNNVFSIVLTRLVLQVLQAGLYDQWTRSMAHRINVDIQMAQAETSQTSNQIEKDSPAPLEIRQLLGPFVVLAIGIMVSVVALLTEVLHKRNIRWKIKLPSIKSFHCCKVGVRN